MGSINCPLCPQTFGSEFELSLHWSHSHRGPMPALKVPIPKDVAEKLIEGYKANAQEDLEIVNETMLYEEPKADEEAPYSLAASREGLGELSPVLKDVNGEIIDGFHRLGESANWHTITVSTIDTPVKLELARLAVNFNRRKVSPEELSQRITFLVKSGLKPEEIAKQTGISKATVYRYTPQEMKNERSAKISEGIKAKRDVSRETSIPDSIPATTGDLTHVTPRVRTFEEAAAEAAAESASKVKPLDFCVEESQAEDEVVPEGYPICPLCSAFMDLAEYKEIKQKAAAKFGKSIQTLLFPEAGGT